VSPAALVGSERDRATTSYYASCVVNLILKYDEALQVAETTADFTQASITKLNHELQEIRARPTTMAAAASSDDNSAARRRAKLASYSQILASKIAANNTVINQHGEFTSQSQAAALAARKAFAIKENEKLDQEKAAIDAQLNSRAQGNDPNDPAAKSSEPSDTQPEAISGAVLVPLSYGGDKFTVFTSRVPVSANIVLPHPREAGTFTLIFDYREFPIDPRLLRAVGVEIHLGTVTADDYARGMSGKRDASGRPLSLIRTRLDMADPVTGESQVDPSTLMFFGSCDRWRVAHTDHSSTIHLEGRDVRGIFLDTKLAYDRLDGLNTDQRIDFVVRDIIKTMASEQDFKLDVFTVPGEWPGGEVPSPGDTEGLTRVRSGAKGTSASSNPSNASGGGGGNKANYWDLITNYCALVGGVPYLTNTGLWIRPARSIFDVLSDAAIATPFAGGKPRQVGDESIRVRRMVWGRNLRSLTFDRKFAGTVVPIVQVVSISDREQGINRLLIAQWPPAETPQAQSKAENEVIKIPVPGINDLDRLIEIAHDIYEEIGRGEMGGSAQTMNLASEGGSNEDADMLRLRPTDPVEFMVDARALTSAAPLVSELNEASRRSFEEEVEILYRQLGDRDIARVLVAQSRGAIPELLQFYQVSRVGFEWSSNDGVSVSFDFQNYVVSRHGQAPSVIDTNPDVARRRARLVSLSATLGAKIATNHQAAVDNENAISHGQSSFAQSAALAGQKQQLLAEKRAIDRPKEIGGRPAGDARRRHQERAGGAVPRGAHRPEQKGQAPAVRQR
jgi:hypothetical protein